VYVAALAALLIAQLAAGDSPGAKSRLIRHDPYSRAAEVFRLSFEGNEDEIPLDQPAGWTRRKGPQFPTYVHSEIDAERAEHGRHSLRFDINGGQAVYYSPPQRIDSLHAYVFEGRVRTQRLKHDAAIISLSFLNHKLQRVQRVLSRPVTGTHSGWVSVKMGPIVPKNDVWFVVVGCHIVQRKDKKDLSGHVWFDNLWLGRLPQLTLVSNYATHFKRPDSPIQITAKIGGLNPGAKYQLRLQLFDRNDRMIDKAIFPLTPPRRSKTETANNRQQKPLSQVWNLSNQPRGFYRVRAGLARNDEVIIEKLTTFIVVDFVEPQREGEFGWSIAHGTDEMPLKDLAEVAAQSGIHWMKYPLWQTVSLNRPNPAAEVVAMFDVLAHRRITPVGLLTEPPPEFRRKFASDWSGVSEIFTMPAKFWWPEVEPVIARYSSTVRHWQVGAEGDLSFTTMTSLATTVRAMKSAFDKIGRDTRIGIPWNWKTPLPQRGRLAHTFLSLGGRKPMTPDDLRAALQQSRSTGVPRWVVIRPLARSQSEANRRGGDLVKMMVAAKAGGAEAIFAEDVFHPEFGLLSPSGTPTQLYLPWRTAALALQGAEFLGSLDLPNGSKNCVFSRDGEGIIVMWRDEPGTEEIFLGPADKVAATDIWGRRIPIRINPTSNRQIIPLGTVPLIFRGCPEGLLRLRLSTRFQTAQFQSRRGGQPLLLLARNAFPQGISGTVKLNVPRGWSLQPTTWQIRAGAGEPLKLPATITVPANASLGEVPVTIDFRITADRPYAFRVHRALQIGMGDVAMQIFDRKLKDGRLEIQQIITNNTQPEETLSFRCSLFSPGFRRQRRIVTKLGKGKDRKFYFLPDAEALRGKTLWIRAEEITGNRVLNFRWKALENETAETRNMKKKTNPKQPGPKAKTPTPKAS